MAPEPEAQSKYSNPKAEFLMTVSLLFFLNVLPKMLEVGLKQFEILSFRLSSDTITYLLIVTQNCDTIIYNQQFLI